MAKLRTYQCPGNGAGPHTFTYLHHPDNEPPPQFCSVCGRSAEEPELAVMAPHVLSGSRKNIKVSADQTYRDMEAAGDANAAAAAEMLGVPKSEMSDLKITNLNDNLREGDIAAKAPDNPVTRAMAEAPGQLGFRGAEAGQYFGPAVASGAYPRQGSKSRTLIQDFHSRNSGAMVAGGEKGRY